jgi:hypothetical protein
LIKNPYVYCVPRERLLVLWDLASDVSFENVAVLLLAVYDTE